ncbi:MAG: NIPSNAP family protein [bacterium]|nr:NIPSNAP family protein [bacterium]
MTYELRTYRIPEGRMPDILSRFKNITFGLFERHNIEVVGFWTRTDANELVYLCRYENEQAMKKSWDAFRADPEWAEARKKTEANGPIVSEVISHTLAPTPFSPIQ